MRRLATMVCGALLLGAGAVRAQSGIGINWDGCVADGRVGEKRFACDVNTGAPFVFYVSVFPTVSLPHLAGARVLVAVGNYYRSTLPPWWLTGTGQCRANAIGMSFDPTAIATTGCADLWAGTPMFSVLSTSLSADGKVLRVDGAAGISTVQDISLVGDGIERIVCRVTIQRAKSTGADACEGCLECQMIVPYEVKLMQSSGQGDYTLTQVADESPFELGWNGYCPPPDPVQNRTWGAIKGMYR